MHKKYPEDSRPKWEAIVLQFPTINTQFRGIEDLMKPFDKDGNGEIDYEELVPCLEKFGIKNDKEIEDIFECCDRTQTKGLKLKEFLVCLALIFLLELFPKEKSNEGLFKAFQTSLFAFLTFDTVKNGQITKAEVNKLFETKVKAKKGAKPTKKKKMKKKMGGNPVWKQRWDQMDWDHNGECSFVEFLFAFSQWTNFDDDDDE